MQFSATGRIHIGDICLLVLKKTYDVKKDG